MSNLMINVGSGDNAKWYAEDFLRQYAKDNNDQLLKTKQGAVIVANTSGWCTLVYPNGGISQLWAGEISLAYNTEGA